MFKLKFGSKTKTEDGASVKPQNERIFFRPGVIEEEPDSMDSIISNPSSYPITVIPANLMRSATQTSMNVR